MMSRTIQLAVLVLFLLPGFAKAQAKLEFQKSDHDFGNIKEENGPAEVVFTFTNTGTEDLVLSYVKASCGCTTPSWTRDPVKPGEKGEIKASYNPLRRPGPFHKTITVKSNANEATKVLRISGKVIPKPKGPADTYPREEGNLRFSSTYVNFGKIFHDGTDTASVVLYNQGTEPVTIDLEKSSTPKLLSVSTDKLTIEPKKTTTLKFKYDASQKNDWGYIYERMTLKTNDPKGEDKRLSVSMEIVENFGEINENTKLPKVKFDKLTHDFGTINQRTTNPTVFTITNEGDAPLIIRKTKASCGCTATKPGKTELAPGESTTLDVTYSSGAHKGAQKKSITIVCNDPKTSTTRLYISANVLEKTNEAEKTVAEKTAEEKRKAAALAAEKAKLEKEKAEAAAKEAALKAEAEKKEAEAAAVKAEEEASEKGKKKLKKKKKDKE